MKVTAHISSYASGWVQYCQHFSTIEAAKDHLRVVVNDWLDGIGEDGRPDATIAIYPYTPEDTDDMCHNDYPMQVWSVGRKRHGRWTLRKECI